MAVSPTVRLNVSGARGESQADILRRTGQYGVLPGDTDQQVMDKLAVAGVSSVIGPIAQPYVDKAQAWAQSPTAPDPADPTSKSAKGWAAAAAAALAAIPTYTEMRLTALENALGLPHGPVPGPLIDAFDAPTGSINGRALSTTASWVIAAYSGTNTASLSVLTAGKLSGNQGAAANGSFGYVQTPVTDRKWVSRRMHLVAGMMGANTYYLADHGSCPAGWCNSGCPR